MDREVFFLDSGDDRIYGAVVSAREPAAPGVVICPSIGFEAYRLRNACYSVATMLAMRGGAAMIVDWVGHGDSSGEPEEATLGRMVEITTDALRYAKEARPSFEWGLCGVRLGACAAAIAGVRAAVPLLMLIQPSLDVDRHFDEIERASRRASLGRTDADERWAFGSPLPERSQWKQDLDPVGELASFRGRAASVRFARPEMTALPPNVEDRTVPGVWTTGLTGAAQRDYVNLVETAVGLLGEKRGEQHGGSFSHGGHGGGAAGRDRHRTGREG